MISISFRFPRFHSGRAPGRLSAASHAHAARVFPARQALIARPLCRVLVPALLLAGAGSALAQPPAPHQDAAGFPERPVRLVISASPGASVDTQGRAIAAKLAELWGKPVLMDYVPGADGAIAHRRVATAAADGYNIVSSGSTLTIGAGFDRDRGYDPLTSFAGITNAVANSQMLVVRPGIGVKTFSDYVAYVKQKNGEIAFANIGFGGIAHVINELVAQRTGTRYNYIPYKGGGPANIAMLGGHIDAMFITMGGPQLEHVRSGRMIALAVSTKERDKGIPQVPSLAELGLKGIDISSWQGYLVPAKTPRPVVEKIHQGFAAALKDPDVSRYLENQGFVIQGTTPAETDRQIQTEIAQFRQIIKAANIRLEQE